jgi:hypothetical protein
MLSRSPSAAGDESVARVRKRSMPRQDRERHGAMMPAELADQLDAVHAGQRQVDEDEVRRVVTQRRQRGLRVGRARASRDARHPAEVLAQDAAQQRVILDEVDVQPAVGCPAHASPIAAETGARTVT